MEENLALNLYNQLLKENDRCKLLTIATELSRLIHCCKEDKIKDTASLVAIRNAIWECTTGSTQNDNA